MDDCSCWWGTERGRVIARACLRGEVARKVGYRGRSPSSEAAMTEPRGWSGACGETWHLRDCHVRAVCRRALEMRCGLSLSIIARIRKGEVWGALVVAVVT